jgi:hypothetical protein
LDIIVISMKRGKTSAMPAMALKLAWPVLAVLALQTEAHEIRLRNADETSVARVTS